jgi:hypothetical protein
MGEFEYKGKTTYIDDHLKQRLIEKVFPDLEKRDKDCVLLVDGKERTGKSKFSDSIGGLAASYFKKSYDVSNFCMTPEEFRERVMKASKNDIIIYDEAHRGMGSRRALSEINKLLVDLMMEMGQKNLFVIIVLPTFFMLDRYPALYRSRGLFHVYERKHQRGFWVYFNEKNKQKLYLRGKKLLNYNCMKWPRFRGKFTNQYVVNEDEYRKKKAESFKGNTRTTKSERFMEQRDVLIYILHKELELSSIQISNLLKSYKSDDLALKDRQIREILGKFNDTPNEIGDGDA